MSVADEDVDLALEQINRIEDVDSKRELLAELARDVSGRVDVVKLPMWLAISQHPEASEGLRNSLIAKLGREFDLNYKADPGTLAELIEKRMSTPGLK